SAYHLVILLGIVLVIGILFSGYSVKEERMKAAEREMQQAWRDVPHSHDAGERFVDGWRSHQVANLVSEVNLPSLLSYGTIGFQAGYRRESLTGYVRKSILDTRRVYLAHPGGAIREEQVMASRRRDGRVRRYPVRPAEAMTES